MDFDSLDTVVYKDADFGNKADLSLQLGNTILITEITEKGEPVFYESYKLRKDAHFVLSARVIAFSYQSDDALAILKQLKLIFKLPRSI